MHRSHGPQHANSICRARGLTLLELLLTVTIGALLMMVSAPSLQDLLQQRRLEQLATTFQAQFQEARLYAVAQGRPVRLVVRDFKPGGCYVFFVPNGAAACDCEVSGPTCSDGVHLISSGGTETLTQFQMGAGASRRSTTIDPLRGTITPTMTVSISAPNGVAIRHSINLLGRVRSCSAPEARSGYAACVT